MLVALQVLPVLRKYLTRGARVSSMRKVLVHLSELVRVEEQHYLHAVKDEDASEPAEETKTVRAALFSAVMLPRTPC
jgi:hypothetical protein